MSKYAALANWLSTSPTDNVVLAFGQIEHILGFALPPSAREYPAFWAGSATVDGELRRTGWDAYLRPSAGTVEFRRLRSVLAAISATQPEPRPAGRRPQASDLILLGCVKTKRSGRHPAADMYTSNLFLGRKDYAVSSRKPWLVLSAKYGVIAPDEEIDYYDVSLVDVSADERAAWSAQVLRQLDERLGDLTGKQIEIHAGEQFRDLVLLRGLRGRGARVVVPLEGLKFGEQLAWYKSRSNLPEAAGSPRSNPLGSSAVREMRSGALSAAEVRDLGRQISGDFLAGRFDLSARPGAPPVSWDSMPEFVSERRIRAIGASLVDVRVFITLMAAMDRARDADRLWRNGVTLFTEHRWTFDPTACTQRSFADLREVLMRTGVSQRHGPDSAAWRSIAEALADDGSPLAVRRAVFEGSGDAEELLAALQATRRPGQRWYPFLSGPKISEMWVRMLAAPGEAKIARLEHLNVAVDVQVRKVTEYLGATDTSGRSLEDARPIIQQTWRAAAEAVAGPPAIAGTVAGLDPALWFLAKWGCTFCERAHRRMPVSRACTRCRLPEG